MILDKACQDRRIIITFDLDIGDLMAWGCQSFPSVVIFRLHDETPDAVTKRLLEAIRLKEAALQQGAIVLDEDMRHRTRLLPMRDREDA